MSSGSERTIAAHGTGIEAWSSAEWYEDAVSWLDAQLAAAGIARTGEVVRVQVRPWAAVMKADTAGGLVWFKAAGPSTSFEVGLYPLLHRIAPGDVLAPLAVDTKRGWLVLPDGGQPLADHFSGTELVDALVTLLPRYGRLQRDLAPHADSLLALGIPDMRPVIMPDRFEQALIAAGAYVNEHGDAGERRSYERVSGLRATFTSWCNQLAASPIAASLDHDDLHAWNILVTGKGGVQQATFFDWGDSVVAHPFTSMLIPLRIVQHLLEVGPTDTQLLRIRDAYLEVFSDLAPRAELVATLELACQVGKVIRALAWAEIARDAGPDRQEMLHRAAQWLVFLLDDSYLGEV